jgi:peptidoglycan/LPS O-acetylase OafA/YrhL
LPALDGLRAIAVAAVILFHFAPSTLPGGFLGVDVFFVVSGFLIARLLIVEISRTGTLARANFWARRARRLLPAVATMTVVVLLLAAVKFSSTELHDLRAQALGTLFYCANWVFIFQKGSYFATVGRPSPFLHMWSLAIEEQFYLVLPLLFFALRRRVARRPGVTAVVALVGAIGSTVWMWVLAKPLHDPTTAYLSTGAHSMGLLVGVALGVIAARAPTLTNWLRRVTPALAAVALLAVLASMRLTSFHSTRLFHGGFLVFSIGCALVIVATVWTPNTGVVRALGVRPLVVIGLRSYSLYLWHWPVLVFLTPTSGLHGAALFWARLGVSVVLAEVSYRCIELPFRNGFVARRSGSRGAVVYFAGSLVAAVLLVFTVAAPAALPPASLAAAAATTPTPTTSTGNTKTTTPTPNVDMFGDSTGLVFGYNGVLHSAQLDGLRVGGDARLGCSSINTDHVNQGVLLKAPSDCNGWEARWRAIAQRDRTAKLAVMTGAWEILDQRVNGETLSYPDPRWSSFVEQSLQHAIGLLAEAGRPVYVFQLPCYGQGDPQFPLPARGDPARINAINAMFDRIAAKTPRVHIVHWRDLVCPNGQRAEKVNGVQLWENDNVHLTAAGAVQVWKWWLPQLYPPASASATSQRTRHPVTTSGSGQTSAP